MKWKIKNVPNHQPYIYIWKKQKETTWLFLYRCLIEWLPFVKQKMSPMCIDQISSVSSVWWDSRLRVVSNGSKKLCLALERRYTIIRMYLVGGFNPSEKYWSVGIIIIPQGVPGYPFPRGQSGMSYTCSASLSKTCWVPHQNRWSKT